MHRSLILIQSKVMYKQIRKLKKGGLFAFDGYTYSRGEYLRSARVYRCYLVGNDGYNLSKCEYFSPFDFVDSIIICGKKKLL